MVGIGCLAPIILAVIVFGMYYDHLLRMIITMTSQYFRLISLPEASFGLISAMLSMLGLYIPKLCESMAANNSPVKNLLLILAVSMSPHVKRKNNAIIILL